MENSLLAEAYSKMFFIRIFEEKIEELFQEGKMRGTVHSCAGQEAVAVGIARALRPGDLITGHHRSHGQYLAFTGDGYGLLAEILGKKEGVVAGRGGSQHLCRDGFFSNGVQGAMSPVATGMAFAEKISHGGNIVVCFLGDGTLGQGVLYESLNMASLWSLPVLYVVENNQYAMSTRQQDAVAGGMIERGRAFGITSSEMESNDVEVVYEEAVRIVEKMRQDTKPYFWVLHTYRLSGHSKGDDRCYRSRDEEAEWAQKDPLILAGQKLPATERKKIEEKCRVELQNYLKELISHNDR